MLTAVIWMLNAQLEWTGFSAALVPVRARSFPGFSRTALMSPAFPQSLLQLRDWTTSMLCSPSDLPTKGFSNQIPLVTRGNCTFYDKVRLAQGSGAHGLLIVSKETLVQPPGHPPGQQDPSGAMVGGGRWVGAPGPQPEWAWALAGV